VEGLTLLNIPLWGAGVALWRQGLPEQQTEQNFSHGAVDDGLVEVVGLYSSFHMAQLQVLRVC